MRKSWKRSAAVAAVLGISGSTTFAGVSANRPAMSAGDAALLAQLQSPVWPARQAAQAALIGRADRGDLDGVEGEVRAMLANATLPESRDRLNRVLDHIAQDRLMRPTMVTMHMHDAPAKALLAELAWQGGGPLSADASGLIAKAAMRLSVEADGLPYWDVVTQLEERSHHQLDFDTRCSPALLPIANQPQLPATNSGPFRFIACSSLEFPTAGGAGADHPDQPFILRFACLSEPGRRVVTVANRVAVLEAIDDHGNSLVPNRSDARLVPPCLGALLVHPAKNPGTRIARFRGTAVVTIDTANGRRDLLVPIDFAQLNIATVPRGNVADVVEVGDDGPLLPTDDLEGQ